MAGEARPFESWVGSETIIDGQNAGSSWDICQLGAIFLPGVVTIDKLVVGRDVDVQKRRKKEKARIRDNGLSQTTFDIIIELTAKQWPDFCKIYPSIAPKEGGIRTPLDIKHPLVNFVGCNTIYIQKIELPPPTPRKGMRIEIHCGEWFEEEVDAKGPSKKVDGSLTPGYSKPDYFGDPNDLAKTLKDNAGFPPAENIDNVMSKAFGEQ